MRLFRVPELEPEDFRVIDEIDDFRRRLRHFLREPRRWKGQLRRNLKARAIRGSNSIEGYDVSFDDAVALIEDEEPLDADRLTSLEIVGYRNALTYVQQLAEDTEFSLDQSLLRSLHFMMLGHDLAKSPGRYRRSSIFVHDEEHDEVVYEGPEPELVPELMRALTDSLAVNDKCPVFVRAALGHLNLVMIHPFRDGNGRMARALQTLILAREKILTPEFSSIEEWLGRNTNAYYAALAEVGGGYWRPERDTSAWIRFNLTAHHMQAQTVLRRADDAARVWRELETVLAQRKLPERTALALFDASVGLTVRRSAYGRDAELEPGTAARDLRLLVASGLLAPHGETKSRIYVASEELRSIRSQVVTSKVPPRNPYQNGGTGAKPRKRLSTR
ncbi:Fic family protein [Crossiella cryophila]|uniref:Fic family protein n=1 Tax=Crossiella cryophila TaxID=43355 RepID=A0A7W7CJ90_9PSEU|nr:Fic family protein [Crossiella cryophila]MBB4682196.1 Fic family protein [Crossiella cryophila]